MRNMKAPDGIMANRGKSKGACARRARLAVYTGQWVHLDIPGGRHLHRKGRHYGYRGSRLLVLLTNCVLAKYIAHIFKFYSRRLKLVTGVDISTRPARRLGKEGKPRKSRSRNAEAAPYKMVFRRSIVILISRLESRCSRASKMLLLLVAVQRCWCPVQNKASGDVTFPR